MPNDLPPSEAVYQQTQRWIKAGIFEAMVHDLRAVLRLAQGRPPDPTAAVLDSRTLRSTPESGRRGGYDGAKRKKGSKVHAAVDTLGHLLALRVTPATEQCTPCPYVFSGASPRSTRPTSTLFWRPGRSSW